MELSMKRIQILLPLVVLLVVQSVALPQNAGNELNDQLWEAARSGDAKLVATLLDKGADVNARFRYGTTALFKAAERGHAEVVKVLLARGADATVRDTFYGATAMTWALDHKHVPVIEALLEKDPSGASDVLLTGVNDADPVLVAAALRTGRIQAETLTAALASASQHKEAATIVSMLEKAGAKPPFEVDATTLASYTGTYKATVGNDLPLIIQEGKLFAVFGGQRYLLIALQKTVFRPVTFEGLTITFEVKGDKVIGFTMKQGNSSTAYTKNEEQKQP
jgi:hypothetical protein